VQAETDLGSFGGVRWNGWLILVISIICICVFIIVQVLLSVYLIFHDHPEIMQSIVRYGYMPPALRQQMADPGFMIALLNAKNLWLLSVVSEATLAAGTIFLARILLDATPRTLGFRGRPSAGELFAAVSVGLLLFVASSVIGALITHFFGSHPQPQALALIKHHGLFDFTLDFMSVAIAAPIAEEIFFRGLLFASLAQRLTPWLAMVISAIFFGVAHLEKWSFLPILAIGIGLAWLYYQTRNLWLNIVAHATVNTVSLILAYTVPQLVK